MIILLDPTFREIKDAMKKLESLILMEDIKDLHKTIFIGLSSHGTSIDGKLYITLPTQ
jgi:hypothetical protein